MRRAIAHGVATTVFALGAACSGAGESGPVGSRYTIKVSAELRSASRLSIDTATVTVVGGLRRDPEEEFNHRNGFLSGVPLSGDRFAVIDEYRVRVIDRLNHQVAVFGKRGRGPDEALGYSAICSTRGDTLIAYDISLRRVSVLDSAGALVRQFSASELGAMTSHACFDDGTFLVARRDPMEGGTLGGLLLRVNTRGKVVSELGEVELMTPLVQVSVLASSANVWIADPRSPTIRVLDASGRPAFDFLLRERRRRLSPDEARRRSPVASVRGGSAGSDQRLADADMLAPYFERVLVEDGRRLWIQMPQQDLREVATWVAVSDSGTVLGFVEFAGYSGGAMPPLPIKFVDNGVWLLMRDEDGVATFGYRKISGMRSRAPN
jgi:hypothetical protein